MELAIQIIIYTLIIGGFIFQFWLSRLNYNNRNAELPEEVKGVYNEDEYKKWLEYYMENHRFSKITSIVNIIIFLGLLVFRVFPLFGELSEGVSSNFHIQTLVFLGLYFLISFVIGIPFSYYDTFVIEEKYGFNKATKKTFIFDKIKSLLLTIILGGGLVYLITVLFEHAGNLFYILTWASLIVIILLIQVLYVRVFIPIFNKLTPLDDGELKDMIHEFANKVGYEVTKISVMDASKRSSRLNAFFVGFGRFKQIVLYDTLIEKMNNEEILAVLAHEIGHNKHKHIIFNLAQTAVTLSIYMGALWLVISNPEFSTAFGFEGLNFGFSLILFTVLLEPISVVLGLLTSYISRRHEFQADRFAASNFKKEPMESALKVLVKENFSHLTPHPLYVKLLYSHPPVYQRIRAIRKVENNE